MEKQQKPKWAKLTFAFRVKCVEYEVLADALAGEVINEAMNTHGVTDIRSTSIKLNGREIKYPSKKSKYKTPLGRELEKLVKKCQDDHTPVMECLTGFVEWADKAQGQI